MRRAATDLHRSFRDFTLFASVLVVATIALGLSGIQYRSERTLPVSIAEHASGVAEPRVAQSHATDARGEQSWLAWHVAELPPRDDESRWLRLSALLDGEIVELGPDPSRPPIVATWFTRPDGTRQNVAPKPLGVGVLERHEWRTIREWPEHATEVVAAAMPRAMHGELLLGGFGVEIVSLSTTYRTLLALLAAGWTMLAASALYYVRPRLGGPATLAPLALATFIGVAAMFSSDFIDNVVRPIVSLAHGTRAGVSLVATFKVGHAVAFALLTASLLAVRRRLELSPPQIAVLIALLAIASESAQLHLPARTAQLSDLGIDALGVLGGLLLWQIGHAARRRWLVRLETAREQERAAWDKARFDAEKPCTSRRY